MKEFDLTGLGVEEVDQFGKRRILILKLRQVLLEVRGFKAFLENAPLIGSAELLFPFMNIRTIPRCNFPPGPTTLPIQIKPPHAG